MKKPTQGEQERSLEIRKRGKRGEHIPFADQRFNQGIFRKFPEWYRASESIVFNATVPFGSTARQPVDPELYK